MLRRLIVFAVLLPGVTAFAADPPWIARSKLGMVAADSPEASRIGADVLAAGGNAFDAAIATSFALAVARPESTGLGGGGFMLAYVAKEKRVVVLDFREMAPKAATAEHYAKLMAARGDGPSPSIYGGNAIGVPGQLAGVAEIHKRFATKPLGELVAPARKLAEQGFTVDEHYRGACRGALEDMKKWPDAREKYRTLYNTLLSEGKPSEVGVKLKRPDLAKALELIGERGAPAIYDGPIGEAMAKAAQAAGGVLTTADLAAYRVREREPVRGKWGPYEIVTMPPPSSGGVCLIETLNVFRTAAMDFGEPAKLGEYYAPLLVTAFKHAFADRARWLGDPDFVKVPVTRLTSREYADELAAKLRPPSSDDYGSRPPDDRGTSHFCVADKDGNVVALTETINGTFGSLVIAEPYGIVLNNQMDDFTTEPGTPNLFGLIQSERNAIAPGKRPLSSMSPTIVFEDGRPVLALGASGGPRIITAVTQVLLNTIELRKPLAEAVDAVRLHHQWLPDEVNFDREPADEMANMLKAAGERVSEQRRGAVVQVIQLLSDGTMIGASDPRKDGRPAAP